MTVELYIPLWMKQDLNLREMTVYIDKHDNDRYIVYDEQSSFVTPIGNNPWGTVDYDRSVYEAPWKTMYYPTNQDCQRDKPPSKRVRTPDDTDEPRRKVVIISGINEEGSACTSPEMTRISFITHFLGYPESPTVELLGKIYDILDGSEITQQTLDVVYAVIQFIAAKSLKNDLSNVKRKKRFRAQMQYILSKLQ